jgi:hypothetical protein
MNSLCEHSTELLWASESATKRAKRGIIVEVGAVYEAVTWWPAAAFMESMRN